MVYTFRIMKLKKILKKTTSFIGKAIDGPLSGVALSIVRKILNVNTDDELSKLLESDPDAYIKLKLADKEFEKFLKESEIDIERIHQEDRDSARKRQVDLKDKFPSIIAVVIMIGFFSTLTAFIFIDIPDSAQTTLNILIGALAAGVTQVLNFYFGSSSGSKRKTEVLANGHGSL